MNKKQNLYFLGFILMAVVMFLGFWGVRISQDYYSAFVTARGNKSEAVEQIQGFGYPSDEIQYLRPWLEKVDSFRNSSLQDTIVIKASDGAGLSAYYYDMGSDTTVLVLHNFNSDGNGDFYFAPYYAEKGFNVLFTESRGFGNSGGSYIGYGFFEKNDLKDWIQCLIERNGQNHKIIIHGEGMGAAAAIMASGEGLSGNVKFIVAESVYASLDGLAKYLLKESFGLPPFPVKNMIDDKMKKNAGYTCKDVNVITYAKKGSIPALFISGSADTVVPQEMSEQVYDAYAGEKEYLLVEGAGHGAIVPYGEELCTELMDHYIQYYLQ
ncbi:MAG TPA: alpha/beta hydrolase [Clostridiales bacterium]|nr:alpha/beta hydrolase [Clostridiales bacterium]